MELIRDFWSYEDDREFIRLKAKGESGYEKEVYILCANTVYMYE